MFAVLEYQSNNGTLAVLVTSYNEYNDALAKFFQTMISATQSEVEKHTVAIVDEFGTVIRKETVFHEK